jgi:hypothetical protein
MSNKHEMQLVELAVVKWHSGQQKWLLLIVVVLLAVVLTYAVSTNLKPLYAQADIRPEDSNLSIKGVVSSVEESHRAEGWSVYHVYRYYLTVNISEIVWIEDDLANWNTDFGRNPDGLLLTVGKNITIGYDYLDDPQITVGQIIECKGYYASYTDTPESIKLTIAPAISESYLLTASNN